MQLPQASTRGGPAGKLNPDRFTCVVMSTERPNFSGIWVLDQQVSESLDPILKAQGMNLLLRGVVNSMGIKQVIEDQHTTVRFTIKTLLGERQDQIQVDQSGVDEHEGATSRSFWDAGELVTVIDMQTENQQPANYTVRRQLAEGNLILIEKVEFRTSVETHQVQRIYRRQIQ
ncbi:MAG: hypothetical protein HC921_11290 [Synechococcaceae cyanobacterium SM2_3_1]|nr:hypothetical protein [Synechococcaceae cyanobacterium SM2_3_1]